MRRDEGDGEEDEAQPRIRRDGDPVGEDRGDLGSTEQHRDDGDRPDGQGHACADPCLGSELVAEPGQGEPRPCGLRHGHPSHDAWVARWHHETPCGHGPGMAHSYRVVMVAARPSIVQRARNGR